MSRIVVSLALCSLAGILFLLVASLRVVEDLSPQGCRMSWMSPSYVLQSNFDASWTPLARRYSLYLYREVGWESNQIHKGVPVLFIPGNAGSSRQVRSIASSAARQYFHQPYTPSSGFASRGFKPLDVFAVEFNEDLSAFHGPTLEAQTQYTSEAIRYILSLYPTNTQIIIMGHSMGGIVATSLLPSEHISAIITMSTPHTLPPARFDQRIDAIYKRNQHALISDKTPILSLCGGATDMMIPSESCILPLSDTGSPFRRTVFSSALEGAWTGVGHREMVWCHQVRWRIARAALELSGARSLAEKGTVLDVWLRDGHTLPPPSSVPHPLDDIKESLSLGQVLNLKGPQGPGRYLLPVPAPQSRFVLFVSQGSIPPVSPQNPKSLEVSVRLCSRVQVVLDCKVLVPVTHKLIPNPIPGRSFPVPDEGTDESEGVVLFEADIPSPAEGLWVAVDLNKANGDGWVVGGLASNVKLVSDVSIWSLLLGKVIVKLPESQVLRTTIHFPNLLEDALVVYRVSPLHKSSPSDTLLHPLLAHLSHPSETHYFSLTVPPPRRILLHTHASGPYIRSRVIGGLEVDIYSSDVSGWLREFELSVDWMGTLGRWSSRYLTTLPCWIVGVVSLILYEAWSVGDHGAAIPTVYQSLRWFGRRTYPKLMVASFLVSVLPVSVEYYLGNSGTLVFAPIAPLLLTVATGLVYVSWALLNVIMWPVEKVGRLFFRGQRQEVTSVRRSTILSTCLLFVLIFFFIPWQVAYLSCWIIHLYTCASASATPVGDSDEPILLTRNDDGDEVENEDETAQQQGQLRLIQFRIIRDNDNYNSHMLLFMTWLLPLAAPILVVWVRTLVTAGLTTPFDGDHFFMNVAPFLVMVDFASWKSTSLMYPKSSLEKYLSIKWGFALVAGVAFFIGPRWAYRVFDVAKIVIGALVVIRIGPRYWGGGLLK
ncbi:PGAP1-domain-containing protein [Marasmius fiardii PR-910]|nr:PGAP1-domain-containing protein [Marasmius fiardii PR-910]